MTLATIESRLKQLFYFRLLAPEQLNALADISSCQHYEAGEMIFGEGEAASAFYILLSGRVQIYKISPEGKEMILHLFGPGDMFAEVPIFSGIPKYPANALCMEACEVLCVQGAGFKQLIETYPDIAISMISVFAKRLHHFSDLIEDLSLRNVDSRLAKYLLSVSEQSPDKAVIMIHKKTLAAILGTIPETLSRTFKKLSNDGLVDVNDNKIAILDRVRLIKLANTDHD